MKTDYSPSTRVVSNYCEECHEDCLECGGEFNKCTKCRPGKDQLQHLNHIPKNIINNSS